MSSGDVVTQLDRFGDREAREGLCIRSILRLVTSRPLHSLKLSIFSAFPLLHFCFGNCCVSSQPFLPKNLQRPPSNSIKCRLSTMLERQATIAKTGPTDDPCGALRCTVAVSKERNRFKHLASWSVARKEIDYHHYAAQALGEKAQEEREQYRENTHDQDTRTSSSVGLLPESSRPTFQAYIDGVKAPSRPFL